MDYKTIIDGILIALAIFEQLLGYLPEGYPHSSVQLIVFIFVKLWRILKPKKQLSEIIVLEKV